jgi:multiple sugar transport system permease protein
MMQQIEYLINKYFKWIVIVPALVIIVITAVVPTIWLLKSSLFVENLILGEYYFAGLHNYIDVLKNREIWGFVFNTFIYVLGSVGVGFFISLGLGKLLASGIRFRTFFMVCIILPWVFPKIAGAIMWQWMTHQLYGVLNYFLKAAGLTDHFIAFMAHADTTMLMLIIVDMWYWTPFATLVLFGGFTRVPNEMVEAARVDGANAFKIFRLIEVPYILPEILAVLILRTMFTFREFGIPYLMGQGGPGRSTEVLGLTIYKTSIKWLEIGTGSALSVIMLVIMVLIVLFYFKLIRVE